MAERFRAAEERPVLIIGLTLVAGGVDALGYFRLGHVFVANMTGNLVLLAIAVTGGHAGQAIRSLWALFGFMAGAAGASALRGDGRVRRMAALETIFLLVMGILFLRAQLLGQTAGFAVLAVGSLAMGVQSRLARLVNLAGTTTTVVTSTLTQVIDDLVQLMRRRVPTGWSARLAVFAAYAIGAGLAALGRHHPLGVMAGAVVLCFALWLSVARRWPEPRDPVSHS